MTLSDHKLDNCSIPHQVVSQEEVGNLYLRQKVSHFLIIFRGFMGKEEYRVAEVYPEALLVEWSILILEDRSHR